MRKLQAILILVGGLLVGGASVSSNVSSGIVNIFYRNQKVADAALVAFDRANPDCELWTNWQKLCSRTGQDGATRCTKSSMQVKPSTPFCVARSNGPYLGLEDGADLKQLKSYQRFTVRLKNSAEQHVFDLRWDSNRPFSGLRIDELRHPWCTRWGRAISSDINPEKSRSFGYYCASRRIPEWCESAGGLGYGIQDGQPVAQVETVMAPPNPAFTAVNGVFCQRRRKHAE